MPECTAYNCTHTSAREGQLCSAANHPELTTSEGKLQVTPGEHPCAHCGMPHGEYLNEGGYAVGQVLQCGSRVVYDIEVTESHQLIWHGPRRETITKGCLRIRELQDSIAAQHKALDDMYEGYQP